MIVNKIKNFINKYESYLSPVTLISGFVLDSIALRRVDLWAENLIIMIYLALATLAIMILNIHETGWLKFRIFNKTPAIFSVALQFIFGGLFSAFFIFYSRSASLAGSWPFLLFLVLIMVGNEKFRGRYLRASFQVSILYIAYFSYLVFALPIFLKQINAAVFVVSGLTSLIMIGFLGLFFFLLTPKIFKINVVPATLSVLSIYVVFNAFYFFNLIPPIPLALKESGIYHSVERAGADYQVLYEPSPWYDIFNDYKNMVTWKKGEPLYCFSSVFAPTRINAKIYHVWYFYDETSRRWQQEDRLGFQISGGRDGGYRGYSMKYGVRAGAWRIDIENEQGQMLGRIKFDIVETDEPFDKRLKIIK